MKRLINNYTFNATAKTVTFTDFVAIALERTLIITNVTDQITIYDYGDPAKGGTVATNVLTLEHDTTSMSDTDKLQIFYDYEEGKTETAHAQRTTSGTTTLKSVAAGKKIVVTALSAFSDNANTTDVKITFKVGANIIRQHAGVAPGSGFTEIGAGERGEIVEGADGEDFTAATDGTEKTDLMGSWQEVTA